MVFLDVIWSMFVFFLMVAWIWTLIGVVSDVFRSHDLGGMGKSVWVLLIIMIPWLGVLAYILIRGEGMQKRNIEVLQQASEAQRAYIQSMTTVSAADELVKLSDLKDKGVISEDEFAAQKAKLLA